MTRAKRKTAPDQFDLFLPYLSDLPLRDQREMMERPFFSLSKTKRVKPIDYTSPDGKLWVNVSPNAKYGMATIWDADILIYCASQMADMKRRGVNDIPRTLRVMPYDILRSIGRPTTGRAYELLAQALDRLVATTIKTNIRAESRREATFTWLDGWTQIVDEKTERSMGMTFELSNWFYEGVMMEGGVLSIDPAYFDITGGRERWLYRVARKHAGGAGEAGFAIAMPTLFEKSGAEGQYRRFKFEMLKLVEKNALPGYGLSLEEGRGGDPLVRMRRIDGKDGAKATRLPDSPESVSPGKQASAASVDQSKTGVGAFDCTKDGARTGTTRSRATKAPSDSSSSSPAFGETAESQDTVNVGSLVRSAVAGLTDAATRGYMTPETIEHLRATCPGWDLYALHADFEQWVAGKPERLPANWQKAFIGWVKRHHAKNRSRLNA